MPRSKSLNQTTGYTGNTSPSSSNNTSPPSSRKPTSPKKTRVLLSVQTRAAKKNEFSGRSSRTPRPVRESGSLLQDRETLSDSSADDTPIKAAFPSGLYSDSSESDSLKSRSSNSSSSGESSETFTEPKISDRSKQGLNPSSSKTAETTLGESFRRPSFIVMLVQTIWQTIDDKNWDRLGRLIDSMHETKFRLDNPVMKSNWLVQNIIELAPLALLTASEHHTEASQEKRLLLALDLLSLGCNWDAKDSQGNRVIDLLRKQATPSLIEFVVEEFPHLKHLFSTA